jgi:hypothetical protein
MLNNVKISGPASRHLHLSSDLWRSMLSQDNVSWVYERPGCTMKGETGGIFAPVGAGTDERR